MIPIGKERRLPVFPVAVYALIAINVFVYVQEAIAPDPDRFINAFAAIPFDISHGVVLPAPSPSFPPLTLVTAMFLHASLLHIGFNMLFLFVFGPEIEYLCGHVRFVLFYLFAGIAGNVAQLSIDPSSHIPAIGASGAIAGVLGAYLLNFPTSRIDTIVPVGCLPIFLRLPAVLVIGVWAAVQFVHGFGSVTSRVSSEEGATTAYFAHIGGFLSGIITIGLFRIRRSAARRYRYYY